MLLKNISKGAVPRALELAERYRLLNEPEQAESICHDVLNIEPANQSALRIQLLAMSDQFSGRRLSPDRAEAIANRLDSEYERNYYAGVIRERYARALLSEGRSTNLVYHWIERAMEAFEAAEALRQKDDDSSLLRWNTCARLLETLPSPEDASHLAHFGD